MASNPEDAKAEEHKDEQKTEANAEQKVEQNEEQNEEQKPQRSPLLSESEDELIKDSPDADPLAKIKKTRELEEEIFMLRRHLADLKIQLFRPYDQHYAQPYMNQQSQNQQSQQRNAPQQSMQHSQSSRSMPVPQEPQQSKPELEKQIKESEEKLERALKALEKTKEGMPARTMSQEELDASIRRMATGIATVQGEVNRSVLAKRGSELVQELERINEAFPDRHPSKSFQLLKEAFSEMEGTKGTRQARIIDEANQMQMHLMNLHSELRPLTQSQQKQTEQPKHEGPFHKL